MPGWALWVDAWAAALRSPEMAEVSQRLDVRWKDAVAEVIAAGRRVGEIHLHGPERRRLAPHRAARRAGRAGDRARRRAGASGRSPTGCARWPPPSSGVEPGDLRAERDPRVSHRQTSHETGWSASTSAARSGAKAEMSLLVEPLDREVGEHASEGRRELEAVPGTEPDAAPRVSRAPARRRSRGQG